MNTLIWAVVYAGVGILAVRHHSRFDGRFSPVSVAVFSILYYVVTVPVELVLRGDSVIGFTGFQLPEATGTTVVVLAVVSLACLALAFQLVAGPGAQLPTVGSLEGARAASRAALLVSVLAVLLIAALYRSNVVAATDYLANVAQTTSGGSVGYFVLNRWAYLSYGVFAFLALATSKRKWRQLPLLIPLLAWSIYSNDKDPLLVAGLALTGWGFRELVAQPFARWRGLVLGALVLLPVVGISAAAYGTSRAGEEVTRATLDEYLYDGLFTNIDPAGPSGVLAVELQRPEGVGSFDPTIAGAFLWLPSFLRPVDAVEDLGVGFAKSYWPNWEPGFGYGYSPVAEGYQADGALGVVIVFTGLGIVLGFARRKLVPSQSRRPPSTVAIGTASYFVVIGYLSFVVMRGSVATMVSTATLCLVLVALIWTASRVSLRLSRSA
jgi:hypothetical protein